MQNTIQELQTIVAGYAEVFRNFPTEEFSAKPLPHKWSKKEILGHLIDSAQNNLRRFICAQYEIQPPVIVYQQDFWVASNNYQAADKEDLVELWRLINLRICSVLDQMPVANHDKECDTGTRHTLRWIAEDYVKHLKHHINQIISGSFDVTYP